MRAADPQARHCLLRHPFTLQDPHGRRPWRPPYWPIVSPPRHASPPAPTPSFGFSCPQLHPLACAAMAALGASRPDPLAEATDARVPDLAAVATAPSCLLRALLPPAAERRQVPCSAALPPLPNLLHLRLLVDHRLHHTPSPGSSSARGSIQGRIFALTTKTRGLLCCFILDAPSSSFVPVKCTTTRVRLRAFVKYPGTTDASKPQVQQPP